MRLLFKQSCACTHTSQLTLPTPSIYFESPPDMSEAAPSGTLRLDFKCTLCGRPWQGSALADIKFVTH